MAPALRREPQLTTTARLLKLGESITFAFHVTTGVDCGPLEIFPRYLERARPGRRFTAGGDPDWLDALRPEVLEVQVRDGEAAVTYRPLAPGSYLARWRAGNEVFYRYFAAVEDDWIVLRFSAFEQLEVDPTLHATGIPLDYRLPAERFHADDPLFRTLLSYHRHYGDTIIPLLPDTPDLTHAERVQRYRDVLAPARALLPDQSGTRSARLEARHDLDPGYTAALMELGVNDHCGLQEANAKPWLGMPEFPYFSSPTDCRKVNQAPGGSVVAHQWDFCGGWHFIGPVSWHYKASAGDWPQSERCLREGMEELRLLAESSGHPAFAVPLYDGLVGAGYPNPAFRYATPEPRSFSGCVAEVAIVPRALRRDEVRQVMERGPSAVPEALAFWPVNEGRGSRVSAAADRGPEGRLEGEPQWVRGPRGVALCLDGDDDRVVMDRPVAISETDFTMGCWVKPGRSQRPWANLLSSHNNDPAAGYRGVSLEQDGYQTNRFYLIGGGGTEWIGTGIATQLRPDVWQHFMVVRQGGRLTHYLDGEVSAEGSIPPTPFQPATDPFRVGDWARGSGTASSDMLAFVERYQQFLAFRLPKEYQVVYSRSIDIADYYRRHFAVTPRTVFVSRTDHVMYDRWWLCDWCAENLLVPRERLPWDTRVSTIHRRRRSEPYWKDPLSYEYLLVEDQQRSIRFERECPNPIWWFDYTHQERTAAGSAISHTETPDVDVQRSAWVRRGSRMTLRLTMQTQATFPDYAIALWGLPDDFDPLQPIRTNAKQHVLARNRLGEHHLVLFFDLEPGTELWVTVGRKRP